MRRQVAPSAYVDESAQVIGDVVIGEESSVWMNAVVRGDVNHIRIGSRTNIQDGTIVHVMRDPSHPTTVGDDVTVGHGVDPARVHRRGPLPHRHGRDPAERLLRRRGLHRRRRDAAARGHGGAGAIAGDGQPRKGAAAA